MLRMLLQILQPSNKQKCCMSCDNKVARRSRSEKLKSLHASLVITKLKLCNRLPFKVGIIFKTIRFCQGGKIGILPNFIFIFSIFFNPSQLREEGALLFDRCINRLSYRKEIFIKKQISSGLFVGDDQKITESMYLVIM